MSTNLKTAGSVRKRSLREQVYDEVRSRLHCGVLGHDDRIVDNDLAAELGVSRMPVREALLQLVSEGVLDSSSRGFVLRRFTVKEIEEVFQIRHLLEPAAAVMALPFVVGAALKRLGAILADASNASRQGSVQQIIIANAAFRDAWLNLVPNAHLRQEIVRFSDYVQAVRLMTLQDPGYRADSVRRLEDIVAAFAASDRELVASAVARQLDGALAAFVASLTDG
ncbi:GntR family transcriptional regulator [Mesorhizobium sp. M0659]|uniref:GntR family transcriptional regulator n=1 Tax=Mesorhizobium sp. M0659 TaxID=2956980 RepID=UPI0033387479